MFEAVASLKALAVVGPLGISWYVATCVVLTLLVWLGLAFTLRYRRLAAVVQALQFGRHLKWVVDAKDRDLFVSKGLLEQRLKHETSTQWLQGILHESFPRYDYRDLKKRVQREGAVDIEVRHGQDDYLINIYGRTIKSTSSPIFWSLDSTRNIFEKNKRMSDRQNYLNFIIDQSPIGTVTIDDHGRIQDYNKAFESMASNSLEHPLSNDDLKQFSLVELLEGAAHETVQVVLSFLRGETVPSPIEMTLSGKKFLHINVYLSHAQSVSERLHTLYFVDITELKSVSKQFAQSQKMQAIGQLAGGIAHDFNNLLTAMIGFCDLLLLRHSPSDLSFNDIMQIKHSANRAANLVRQLLAFSRQQTLHPKSLDVTDILSNLTALLRRLIGPTIHFNMVHEQNLGLIKADQGQFEQVITNLVVNARDAMPEGGTLSIATHNCHVESPVTCVNETMPPGQYVVVNVADSGVGISRENLPHIFEPFFSTKEVGAGTGLGLSMVHGIVRQSGGYILVESELGQGTVFKIYWPCQADTSLASLEDHVTRPPVRRGDLSGQERIMLVEDEDAVRIFAARALRDKGYTVIEAADGEQALVLLADKSHAIDVLVTDVIMAPVDGTAVAQRARELYPDLEIIFISGYAEDSLRQKLNRLPRTHFLSKPFELKELANKLKDVTEGKVLPSSLTG